MISIVHSQIQSAAFSAVRAFLGSVPGSSYPAASRFFRRTRGGGFSRVLDSIRLWRYLVINSIPLVPGLSACSANLATFAVLLWLPFASEVRAEADPLRWTNPILPQRADPHVTFHSDGYYYLTATVPKYDLIELRCARTLGELSSSEPKVIWRKHDHGPMGAHIWAPELHFIDGKWYIYFTAGSAENKWAIRPYVLEGTGANPLEAIWVEKGPLKLGWESFSLDGTTFAHRGTRYFVWAQAEHGVRGTNIYISRMDTPLSLTGKITLLARPDHEWERRGPAVCEAPAVLIKNGRVFITYSASATDANYCLGLLYADENTDLLDSASWSKLPEPVFKTDPAVSVFGPGHNSFTTTPDGLTDILVYHARDYEKIQGNSLDNPDRSIRAQAIRWRADGFPEFSPPAADGAYQIQK